MKTLRLHGIGDLRLHEEPVPVPADGEVAREGLKVVVEPAG